MKFNIFKGGHLFAIIAFIILTSVYFSPIFQGQEIEQSDNIQVKGIRSEVKEYNEKGESIQWTNSIFGGMPIWTGLDNHFYGYLQDVISQIMPRPILLTFLLFIGFYILLSAFGVNAWLAFLGGTAYAFATWNIISIEVGHVNKVYTIAYMAPVLAGVVLTFRKRYIWGALLVLIGTGMQVYFYHVQIIYYLLLMIVILGIFSTVYAIKNQEHKHLLRSAGVLLIAVLLAAGSSITRLWTLLEYSDSTIRGGSDLQTEKVKETGLSKDYALSYSYGKWETLNLFIPGFKGGGSTEALDKESNTYQTLVNKGVPRRSADQFIENVPLYWGNQPFTAGPVYLGAISVFLFVFGLFVLRGYLKWWVVAVTALAILLAWGKNLEWLTNFFFYNVPLYNKFRTVSMILAIPQLTVPFLGIIALKQVFNNELNKNHVLKSLKYSFFICGGSALLFALFGSSIFNFSSENDQRLVQMVKGEWLLEAVKDDRASRLQMDAFRTLIFVCIAAAIIWAYVKNYLKAKYAFIAFIAAAIVDLWMIDKRYLNSNNFKEPSSISQKNFSKSPADRAILQDTSKYFNVINYAANTFNEARTAYYHYSLGGYHAAKLSRYQDLIERHLSQRNKAVLGMLNAKYIIVRDKERGEVARRNPDAMGNAWFVNGYEIVKGPHEEIKALNNFNPAKTAFIDQKFKEQVTGLNPGKNPGDTIYLTSYHPEKLVYKSSSSSEQLALFSEVYYQPGWNAYIDGEKVPHLRANYVLRGLKVPSGEHKITFKFEPTSVELGTKIAGGFTILIVLVLGGSIYLLIKGKPLFNENKLPEVWY